MKLLEQYRRHQWNRTVIAGALFPFVFLVLAFGASVALEALRSSGRDVPEWVVLVGLVAIAQLAFTIVARLALGHHLRGRFVRHALIQFACLPVTGIWLVFFYVYAWHTSPGR